MWRDGWLFANAKALADDRYLVGDELHCPVPWFKHQILWRDVKPDALKFMKLIWRIGHRLKTGLGAIIPARIVCDVRLNALRLHHQVDTVFVTRKHRGVILRAPVIIADGGAGGREGIHRAIGIDSILLNLNLLRWRWQARIRKQLIAG